MKRLSRVWPGWNQGMKHAGICLVRRQRDPHAYGRVCACHSHTHPPSRANWVSRVHVCLLRPFRGTHVSHTCAFIQLPRVADEIHGSHPELPDSYGRKGLYRGCLIRWLRFLNVSFTPGDIGINRGLCGILKNVLQNLQGYWFINCLKGEIY